MPEISRFYGLIVYMQYHDNKQHSKPHVHVYYSDYTASVGLDGELLAGELPRKQWNLLIAWLSIHEEELYAAWNSAVCGNAFSKIDPLK